MVQLRAEDAWLILEALAVAGADIHNVKTETQIYQLAVEQLRFPRPVDKQRIKITLGK